MKRILANTVVFITGSFLNALVLFFPVKAARLAMYLFKRPLRGRMNKQQRNYMSKHICETFDFQDYKICYYNWPSEGPSILLAHGWESNSARWKPYLEDLLKRGFNVFALDAPAHGMSGSKLFSPDIYAEALEYVVAKHNIKILVGHSVGAYACLINARNRPDNSSLEHMILMAPNGRLRYLLESYFNVLGFSNSMRSAYLNNFQKVYDNPPEAYDAHVLIENIGLKGVLIHDLKDRVLPYEESLLIADAWPQARFHTTEGYGHRLRSSEVKDMILDYLDSI